MPNVANTQVSVTVRLVLQHLLHYSAVVRVFLPSHLWYRLRQCGLSASPPHHRLPVLAPHRSPHPPAAEPGVPRESTGQHPSPHLIGRSRPLRASGPNSRKTVEEENACGKGRVSVCGASVPRCPREPTVAESLKAGCYSCAAPLQPRKGWAHAPPPWAPRWVQRFGPEERSASQAGIAHTTEASPDTEATLLSSAQGCRFCSAKSDELCRHSGSGGSGGRSGRGSASCCRCRSSRPARCRSASRSSAVWRLDGRRWGVSEAGPGPALARPAPHSRLARPSVPPAPRLTATWCAGSGTKS